MMWFLFVQQKVEFTIDWVYLEIKTKILVKEDMNGAWWFLHVAKWMIDDKKRNKNTQTRWKKPPKMENDAMMFLHAHTPIT